MSARDGLPSAARASRERDGLSSGAGSRELDAEQGPAWRPAFAPSVRLRQDAARDRWVLLAPELVVAPDETALSVLRLIDGRPVGAIVAALAERYAAPLEVVSADVRALLDELCDRGLLRSAAP